MCRKTAKRRCDCMIAEIGSTTTVVTAINGISGSAPEIIAQGQALTTVRENDVTIGLQAAIDNIAETCGFIPEAAEMLAASSAAGGLRMTVHGLVYDMTVKAAREAVLGAGANIRMVTAGAIDRHDLERLESIKPNIIFLAGGVDYGEKNIILDNARKLACVETSAPVIFAGNCAIADEIRELFECSGREIECVDNVYPVIDKLNVEPARRAIQKIFEKHITAAPGMAKIRTMIKGNIMPVPGAVMSAARLLYNELGDLLVVDIGGATTDVHSITPGNAELSKMLIAPEPLAKRSVEGDLGMYVNAGNLVDLLDESQVLNGVYSKAELLELVAAVPRTPEQYQIAAAMAEAAAHTALARHAGIIDYIYGVNGRKQVVRGKDLTAVKWIIGTGGALTKLSCGKKVLDGLNVSTQDARLLPRQAAPLIDADYVMPAAGLLARSHPDVALALLKKSLNIDDKAAVI